LSQQIEILRRNMCSKFTNEDSKYFLSKLLYLYIKHNKVLTWMLPSLPWCLIFKINIICACCRKIRHHAVCQTALIVRIFGGIGVLSKMVFCQETKTYLHKDYKYFCKYNFNELMKNFKLTQTGKLWPVK
jgi:hypothetical protein